MDGYEALICQIVPAPPGWRAVVVWFGDDDELGVEETDVPVFALVEHRDTRDDRVTNRSVEPVFRTEDNRDLDTVDAFDGEVLLELRGPADPPFAWTAALRERAADRLRSARRIAEVRRRMRTG